MTESNQPDQEKKLADDEPILELTDEVTAAPEDAGEPIDDTVDPLTTTIELDEGLDDHLGVDHVEDDIDDTVDPLAATIELEEGLDDHLGVDHVEDDFVDSLGMEIGAVDEEDEEEVEPEETAAEPTDTVPTEGIDVSSEQLDAALDRVIKNMFHDKIDSLLVEVIEKTVSKEIERLKKILTEEVSGD
jgi:hypothetical protein